MARVLPLLCSIAVLVGCKHAPTAAPAPPPLRVLSFNIRLDNGLDGDNGWSHRAPGVQGMLPFYHVDLAGMQEVLPNQLQDLAGALPEYGWFGHGRNPDRGGEACPIFYRKERLELLAAETFQLSPTPEVPGSMGWDAKYPRTATWARLRDRATGTTFVFLNTHLDSVGPQAREEGARLILSRLPAIAGGAPVLLGGDFNSRPDGRPHALVAEAGLRDARQASRRRVYPFPETGTSTGFGVPPRAHGTIDYIFAGPAIEVLAFGVITENWDLLYPSDHRPVIAEVQLPARR
jgi:endonuclease/exonuclease/phosphatase family metal-dependent hydrolase